MTTLLVVRASKRSSRKHCIPGEEVYMKKLLTFAVIVLFTTAVQAQMRPVENEPQPIPRKPSAPEAFNAKYEGGLFGFSRKEKGRLSFDQVNERIVFFGKDGKERFSLSYDQMNVIYPHSRSVTSTTGNVVRHIPLPGAGLAGLIREKRRYLIIQFVDQDADVRGIINFKLDNKELLDSVIQTLGERAGMTQRGDAYYRPRSGDPGI